MQASDGQSPHSSVALTSEATPIWYDFSLITKRSGVTCFVRVAWVA